MANMNDKTAVQIGIDSISEIAHPRKHSQKVEEEQQDRMDFLSSFSSKIARVAVLADEGAQEALTGLLDDIHYSDPIGTESARADETALLAIADELVQAAESGELLPEAQITRAKRLLEARNETCKRTK